MVAIYLEERVVKNILHFFNCVVDGGALMASMSSDVGCMCSGRLATIITVL
jgi:hypothetical protein